VRTGTNQKIEANVCTFKKQGGVLGVKGAFGGKRPWYSPTGKYRLRADGCLGKKEKRKKKPQLGRVAPHFGTV